MMTDAEWADRRDMITWQNQAVAQAIAAERKRIAGRLREATVGEYMLLLAELETTPGDPA